MSLYARLAGLLLVITVIAALWWKADRMLAAADARGYLRAQQEAKAVADRQSAAIRDLQRKAELRYVSQSDARNEFFTAAAKEVRHASAPLAACPLPEPVRVRLNAAAECARGDSTATGCAAGEVPDTR